MPTDASSSAVQPTLSEAAAAPRSVSATAQSSTSDPVGSLDATVILPTSAADSSKPPQDEDHSSVLTLDSIVTIPLFVLLLLAISSFVAGFVADPLIRFADRVKLPSHRSGWEQRQPDLTSRYYWMGDLLSIGDALREFVSLSGFLFGSCQWSSARELKDIEIDISDPDVPNGGFKMWAVTRAELTACGRAWGYKSDNEPTSRLVGGVLHLLKGYTLTALLLVLVGQLTLRWFLFRNIARTIKPAWGERLHFPELERPELMSVSSLVIAALVWTTSLVRSLARGIVKWRIAKMENVVLDVRDTEEKGRKGK
ncbi:hypothetical protein JCM11251_002891 [Rhodosporidiobolus azoricus]